MGIRRDEGDRSGGKVSSPFSFLQPATAPRSGIAPMSCQDNRHKADVKQASKEGAVGSKEL